jgi:chitinase
MKIVTSIKIMFFFGLLICAFNAESQNANKWIMGYLPFYHQDNSGNTTWFNENDWARVSHIGNHGPMVNRDGSLDLNSNSVTPAKMTKIVQLCHEHNKPAILGIVSFLTYMDVINDVTKRTGLISNILNLLDTYKFDGIDVDLEPIMSPWVDGMKTDNPDYILFINELYAELQTRDNEFLKRKPLLVCAANAFAAPILTLLQDKFDMMNLMTYDMSGPYPGWVTWHDSPVYSGGNTFPSGSELPSVHQDVQFCIEKGVQPTKLGIGISFDAFRWKGGMASATEGVTVPAQVYFIDPSWTRFSYSDFMNNYFSQGTYHWDEPCQMSFLSIDKENKADDQFWSFNDEKSCKAKCNYVLENNLGGVIIWELFNGLINSNPADNRIPQLSATYNALYNGDTKYSVEKIVRIDKSMTVFPNPTINGCFIVEFGDDESTKEICVYNIGGELIQTNTVSGSSVNINLNDTKTGLYFILVNSGNLVYRQKIINE